MAQNPPNPPQQPRAFGRNPYDPLDFTACHGYLHDMSSKTLKWLRRLSGDNVVLASDHVEAFHKATRDNDIQHEDISMKLFANSLDGNAYL